jgi:hypothetical protein
MIESVHLISHVLSGMDSILTTAGAIGVQRVGVMGGPCRNAASISVCSLNRRTQTFSGCNLSGAVVNGTQEFTFLDAAVDNLCALTLPGHSVRLVPNLNFQTTSTATLSAPQGLGILVTRVDLLQYQLQVDLLKRFVTFQEGTSTQTLQVSQPLIFTGEQTQNRSVFSGSFRLELPTSNLVCAPQVQTPLSGFGNCTCPTDGTLEGECRRSSETNGNSQGSIKIQFTTCGTATVSYAGSSRRMSLEGCSTR